MTSRLITKYDIYAFKENRSVDPDKFTDIIGRHFKQPKDASDSTAPPPAHMWRSLPLVFTGFHSKDIMLMMTETVKLFFRTATLAAVATLCVIQPALAAERPRVIVLTDIGNEPDDAESMVRFLLYSNELDVEALIATTSFWQKNVVHPELIEDRIRAYGQVLPNLRVHATGFPDPSYLLARVRSGVPKYGMEGVGDGLDTPASNLIIESVDKQDARPVRFCLWGGAADLAQALWKVRATRTPDRIAAFVAKLRVYSISDQDDAGPWIRQSFPGMFWIASIHAFASYSLAAWPGISGDRFFGFEGPSFTKVSNDWLSSHIQIGALGRLYPLPKYIMEGDTPSFLYLIPNGLGDPDHPEYGSWGGRYGKISSNNGLYADTVDRVKADNGQMVSSNQATIWRWRDAYQNDFAGRMQWTVHKNRADAPHNPLLVVNGARGRDILPLQAVSGKSITLDATGSQDPDGGRLDFRWWQYTELLPGRDVPTVAFEDASAIRTAIVPPQVSRPTDFHLILEVHDDKPDSMTSYRRIVLSVQPAPAQ
jgi:hypothetical protein